MTGTTRPSDVFLAVVTAAGLSFGAAPAMALDQDRPQIAQAAEKATGEKVTGKGVIKAINKEDRQLQMTHEAIPALKWGAMTMAFKVAPGVDIEAFAPGAKVTFTLGRSPQGGYVIEQMQRD